MMSFAIYNEQHQRVFLYEDDPKNPTINFENYILKCDVLEGITIPICLKREFKERTFLPYPTQQNEVSLFALAYRKVIFENELVKHGYYLQSAKIRQPKPHSI
jgi:hypothetical protein